jgi:hypothetical protein
MSLTDAVTVFSTTVDDEVLTVTVWVAPVPRGVSTRVLPSKLVTVPAVPLARAEAEAEGDELGVDVLAAAAPQAAAPRARATNHTGAERNLRFTGTLLLIRPLEGGLGLIRPLEGGLGLIRPLEGGLGLLDRLTFRMGDHS